MLSPSRGRRSCVVVLTFTVALGVPLPGASAAEPRSSAAAGSLEPTATLEWGGLTVTQIDGQAPSDAYRSRIELPAGTHRLAYEFGTATLAFGCHDRLTRGAARLRLHAGHVYRIETDVKDGQDCHRIFWIEDTTTGEFVVGRPVHLAPERRIQHERARADRLMLERFEALEERAKADSAAQYRLALWYLLGDTPLPAPDAALARAWLTRAADAGSADATSLLRQLTQEAHQDAARPEGERTP